jgi:uncharacterized protein (TIGR03067 family)
MRILILIIAAGLSLALMNKNILPANDLNGTWIPIKQEIGGTTLPEAAFKNQKLILSDSNYTAIAESTDKGVVKVSGDKMDIYGRQGVNAGKHFTALFKYENGLLTICYDLSGSAYPEGFETKGKRMYFLSVFKREEPAVRN